MYPTHNKETNKQTKNTKGGLFEKNNWYTLVISQILFQYIFSILHLHCFVNASETTHALYNLTHTKRQPKGNLFSATRLNSALRLTSMQMSQSCRYDFFMQHSSLAQLITCLHHFKQLHYTLYRFVCNHCISSVFIGPAGTACLIYASL